MAEQGKPGKHQGRGNNRAEQIFGIACCFASLELCIFVCDFGGCLCVWLHTWQGQDQDLALPTDELVQSLSFFFEQR